ncbi:MAG: sulfurtransferase [Bacteroidota bacterium]
MFTTIIRCEELLPLLGEPHVLIFDTRFYLADTEQGRREYTHAHIPGAIYAHLDEDLSGEIIPGVTGRHPLPDRIAWLQKLSVWGLRPESQVVIYDQSGGFLASRLWTLIRQIGAKAVAVLDGGWAQWQMEGKPTTDEPSTIVSNRSLALSDSSEWLNTVSAEEILTNEYLLWDARAAPRYRGEQEPIDPVAGHIPGAISVPFAENLSEDGRFLPPEQLRTRFEALLNGRDPSEVVAYCGSGVTACHNLLALEIAGLTGAKLYPGSWSEWITDPARGVETTTD